VSTEPSILRVASQWLVGLALTVSLALLSFAVLGLQVTSQETGERIQRRAAAALTDIDQLLPNIEADLKAAAASAGEDLVRVPGYPLPIDLPRVDAESLEGNELRARLLDESAQALYEQGMSAWASGDPEARQDIDRVSTAGLVYRGLGLVQDQAYTYFLVATILLGVLSALLAVILALTLHGFYARLMAFGSVLIAVSLPCLAASVAIRFAFKTAQSEADDFVEALLGLGVDTMWLPIRMYLAASILGFGLVALSSFCGWLSARPRRGAFGEGDAPSAGAPSA
jgi:hypothetical protein